MCELLFAVEGRVGQRKLWGIVSLDRRYPRQCVDAACAQALQEGVYSYKHVKALAERLTAQALAALQEREPPGEHPASASAQADWVQQHALIRGGDEYADLFTHAAHSMREQGARP